MLSDMQPLMCQQSTLAAEAASISSAANLETSLMPAAGHWPGPSLCLGGHEHESVSAGKYLDNN